MMKQMHVHLCHDDLSHMSSVLKMACHTIIAYKSDWRLSPSTGKTNNGQFSWTFGPQAQNSLTGGKRATRLKCPLHSNCHMDDSWWPNFAKNVSRLCGRIIVSSAMQVSHLTKKGSVLSTGRFGSGKNCSYRGKWTTAAARGWGRGGRQQDMCL